MSTVTRASLRGHRSVQSQKGEIKDVEQMSFQTGLENSHERRKGGVFRQSVPDTSSNDWKSSVSDGRHSSAADN